MAQVDWNTEDYDSGRSFEAIPKGRYLGRIDKIEKKDTKDKSGYYFEVEASVEKGDHKGRKLWARLNVSNKSDVAQRIGREQFNALCVSCGFKIGEVRDTQKLVAKRTVLLVDIEKDQQGNPRNIVSGFMAPAAGEQTTTRSERVAESAPAGSKATGDDFDDDIPF